MNPNSFSQGSDAILQDLEGAESQVAVLGTSDLLRALLGGVREAREEIPHAEFEDRIGVTLGETATWQIALNEAYDAIIGAHPAVAWPHSILARRLEGGHREMSEIPRGTVVLGLDERELAAYIAMLLATLEEIEEWEYGTRMGFDRSVIQQLADDLRKLAA
ncbi:hypothetical protein ACFVWR_13710 [Leifsonia sp. NPDC058292]|uniref:hypothetical protein n=1 Tax=Leifsonia sp. NPDC058292 TaxID=3346428 RepID=UPI0036D95A54